MRTLYAFMLCLSLAMSCYGVQAFLLHGDALLSLAPSGARPATLRAALLVHIGAASLAIGAGALQFSLPIRRRGHLHRLLGSVYVAASCAGGGAALFLMLDTTSPPLARMGLATLAVLWMGSALAAVDGARRHDWSRHRAWALRSFALTLSAPTLRIYVVGADLAGLPFDVAYSFIAWLCWIPNLAGAEWLRTRSLAYS